MIPSASVLCADVCKATEVTPSSPDHPPSPSCLFGFLIQMSPLSFLYLYCSTSLFFTSTPPSTPPLHTALHSRRYKKKIIFFTVTFLSFRNHASFLPACWDYIRSLCDVLHNHCVISRAYPSRMDIVTRNATEISLNIMNTGNQQSPRSKYCDTEAERDK